MEALKVSLSLLPSSQKKPSATRLAATKKGSSVFPVGEPGPTKKSTSNSKPIKLLTNVEKLRLLSKAEKAGLLSAAEKAGFSLAAVEKLGLLSKAEELGLLSAATNPSTPRALFNLSILLLALGPLSVYLVPEDQAWQVVLQTVIATVCVLGGSAAFAAADFISKLQR